MRTKHAFSLAAVLLFGWTTAAFAADTDGDGLDDVFEGTILGTNPAAADSDGDGWNDFKEVFETGTDPNNPDSDFDTLLDLIDPSPLDGGPGVHDGATVPTLAGFMTAEPFAPSGQSAFVGRSLAIHNGAFARRYTIGRSRGVRPMILMPECCSVSNAPTMMVASTSESGIALTYNSQSAFDSSVGYGMGSVLDSSYTVNGAGDVAILKETGVLSTYLFNGVGYTTPVGLRDTLTATPGGYVRTLPEGGTWTYSNGWLTSVADAFGNTTNYARNPAGQITMIGDSRGLAHTLAYYPATGRLMSITTADGAAWTLHYNIKTQLMRIEGPPTTSFPGGVWTQFLYINGSATAALNGNMIAEIDGRGNSHINNQYDGTDRVTVQTIGGTDTMTLAYTPLTNQTTVTDRAGNREVWTYSASTLTPTQVVEETNRGVRTGEGDYTTKWAHDSAGYLLTVTYPRGNGLKYTLNTAKLATKRRHKEDMTAADSATNDIVNTWAYDSTKNYGVTSYTDGRGNTTTYTLNAAGQPTRITFPTITNLTPNVTITNSYTFNTDGTVASFTDGEGYVTAYTYFATGNTKALLSTKTVDQGGLGLLTTIAYENWGDVNAITDPRGNTTNLTVERYGNVTQVAAPTALGYITKLTYDGNLNVTKREIKNIDHLGIWSSTPQWWEASYTYTVENDLASAVEDITATTTRTTTFEYDPNDNRSAMQRGDVRVEFTFDERDLLQKRVADPGTGHIAATTTIDYDGNRNRTSVTNPRGKSSTAMFDLFDRPTQGTNALGHYTQLAYDKANNLTERKSWQDNDPSADDLLAHEKRNYDEINRLWQSEAVLQGTPDTWLYRTRTLDRRGLTTVLNDRRGYDTTRVYDGAGRLTKDTDAIGNLEEYTLDANGNVTEIKETEFLHGTTVSEVYETEFTYDALNRRRTQKRIDAANSANSLVTEWKLDALSVARVEIEPDGTDTELFSDGLARITKKSVDLGSGASLDIEWDFDIHNNVIVYRDDAGNETQYDYDLMNRLEEVTYADSGVVTLSLDANGNATTIIDQNGTEFDQDFDDLDRLIARDITKGTGVLGDTDEDFAYDGLNRLTEAKDNDAIVQLTYDSLSRVLTEKQGSNPLGSEAKTVTYTWDAESNKTRVTYPSTFEARRTYDEVCCLMEVDDKTDTSIVSFGVIGRHHRRDTVTFGNGTTTTVGYDGYRRIVEIAHEDSSSPEFASFDYAWDANSNPLYEARGHESGAGELYTYDQANRLTKTLMAVADPANELANPGTETYTEKRDFNMDDVFNLASYVVTPYGGSATTTNYTSNVVNEYTAVGATTHTYDANGNLTDDGTNTYAYDAHNHLLKVTRKSDSAVLGEYKYDALGRGRRTKKTVGSDTTRFIYDGQSVIEEYDGTDLLRLYAYSDKIDDPAMMEAPDVADVDGDSNTTELKRFYYHGQLVGSVTHVTDPDEVVVESYSYDPYGEVAIADINSNSVAASQIGNPWMFTGRRFDEEHGLYHYRARAYSAELRKFVQRDPLGYADGPNAYSYVNQLPTLLVDPLGLSGGAPLPAPVPNAPPPPPPPPPTSSGGGILGFLGDVAGFLWGLPTNIIGAGISLLGGDGGTDVRDAWCCPVGTALTVGDFVFYGDANPAPDTEKHEGAHVDQHDVLGPLYLPAHAVSWAIWCCSFGLITPPLETAADAAAGTNLY